MTTTTDLKSALDRASGYVIDMDGVLYRGDAVLPHVGDFLEGLDRVAVPFVLATNNSTRSSEQYVQKLASMGITVAPTRILTSGQATAARMRAEFPRGTTVNVLGMEALNEAIFSDGYFVPAGRDAEVVASGANFELTYQELKVAALAIRNGAAFIATNGDTTFPSEEGLIPGAGSILAALEAATSVKPEVIGKPSTGMLVQGAVLLGSDPATTIMLGDRLDTDILAGQRAGFMTALVLTGVSTLEELATSEIQPDILVSDLGPLVEYYRSRA